MTKVAGGTQGQAPCLLGSFKTKSLCVHGLWCPIVPVTTATHIWDWLQVQPAAVSTYDLRTLGFGVVILYVGGMTLSLAAICHNGVSQSLLPNWQP